MIKQKGFFFVIFALIVSLFVITTMNSTAFAKRKKHRPTRREIIDGIQRFYKNSRDLRSRFRQIVTSLRFSRKQKGRGIFFYRRPSMMRFQYTHPEPKDFIYNGHTLWMYYPDDQEVKVKKHIKRSQLGIAFQFLWGSGDLEKSFKVKILKKCAFKVKKHTFVYGHSGDICVRLIPRKKQEVFSHLYFSVIPKSYQIREVLYVDNANNCNHFIFSSLKVNLGLPKALFQFRVPKGVDVIPF